MGRNVWGGHGRESQRPSGFCKGTVKTGSWKTLFESLHQASLEDKPTYDLCKQWIPIDNEATLSWVSLPESNDHPIWPLKTTQAQARFMSSQKSSLSPSTTLHQRAYRSPSLPPYYSLSSIEMIRFCISHSSQTKLKGRNQILFISVNPRTIKYLVCRRCANKCLLSWSKLGEIIYSSPARLAEILFCVSNILHLK